MKGIIITTYRLLNKQLQERLKSMQVRMDNMHSDIQSLCTRITTVRSKGDAFHSVHLIVSWCSTHCSNCVSSKDFHPSYMDNCKELLAKKSEFRLLVEEFAKYLPEEEQKQLQIR